MGLQERFRDWKHRFEMHRASRRRELIRVSVVCIPGWKTEVAVLGRFSLHDDSCAFPTYIE